MSDFKSVGFSNPLTEPESKFSPAHIEDMRKNFSLYFGHAEQRGSAGHIIAFLKQKGFDDVQVSDSMMPFPTVTVITQREVSSEDQEYLFRHRGAGVSLIFEVRPPDAGEPTSP